MSCFRVVLPQVTHVLFRLLGSLPQAWNLTGDTHTKEPGAKPWIAEMYGYVFGAAKAGVWHNPADYFHWMYPGFYTYGAATATLLHTRCQFWRIPVPALSCAHAPQPALMHRSQNLFPPEKRGSRA